MGIVSEDEFRLLRLLRDGFESNNLHYSASDIAERLSISHTEAIACARRVADMGAARGSDTGDDVLLIAKPRCVEIVRRIEASLAQAANVQPDIAERARRWARANPLVAWPIIIFTAATSLVVAANQVWAFVDRVLAAFG